MMSLKTLLDDPEFTRAVPYALENYKAGDVIFDEDDEGSDFYLIKSGEVEVTTHVEGAVNPHAAGLSKLGADDVFGELSMFDGEPRSAKVQTLTDCELIHFDGHAMIIFMDSHPAKGYFILREIFMNLIMHMRSSTIRNKTILQLYLAEQSSD